MDAHIQRHGHLAASLGPHPQKERRRRCGSAACVDQRQFRANCIIHFFTMVVIVRHRRVYLSSCEVRVLATNFLGRPRVREVIHHDLCDTCPRRTGDSRRLGLQLLNVRIGNGGRHIPIVRRRRRCGNWRTTTAIALPRGCAIKASTWGIGIDRNPSRPQSPVKRFT